MGQTPVSSSYDGGRAPFVVAHRAGNRLADLRAIEQLGETLAEADVRLHRGRLEVRHLKSVGPLPLLWDRWQLAAPRRPRLQLQELLAATDERTHLVLDLKGPRVRLAERALEAVQPYLGRRTFTICARHWQLLDPFADAPVRRVYSVGSPRQLRRLCRRFAGERLQGVSIHERLLDRDSVARLRAIADVIMTWPVNQPERAHELLRLGVDGLITDDAVALSRSGVLGSIA